MSNKDQIKKVEPKTGESVLLLLLAFFILIPAILIYEVHASIALLTVAMLTTFYCKFRLRYSWEELMEGGIKPTINRAMGAILILIMVGPLIGSWLVSGTIPYFIYIGIQLLNPRIFLVAATIICSFASLMTGTSWGTVATLGVALMGVAQGLGVPAPITAGAIVTGAYFGDKLSPISDTTNLAAAVAETDLFDHVKSMLYTTVPALIISLVVYQIVSLQFSGSLEMSEVSPLLEGISNTFNLNIVLLLPPVVVLYMAYKRFPTIPTLWVGTALAVLLALIYQGTTLNAIAATLYEGGSFETGVSDLDSLLNRGGITEMLAPIVTVFMAYIFAGELEYTGILDKVVDSIKKLFIKGNQGNLITATTVTGVLTALATGNSYLSEIMPGRLFIQSYNDFNIDRRVLSRTLEDAGTVVVPLIPWSAAGIYIATMLDVQVIQYLPWAILGYTGLLINIIYGYTNKFMWKKGELDNKQTEDS